MVTCRKWLLSEKKWILSENNVTFFHFSRQAQENWIKQFKKKRYDIFSEKWVCTLLYLWYQNTSYVLSELRDQIPFLYGLSSNLFYTGGRGEIPSLPLWVLCPPFQRKHIKLISPYLGGWRPFLGQTSHFGAKFQVQSKKFQILRSENYSLFQFWQHLDRAIEFFGPKIFLDVFPM